MRSHMRARMAVWLAGGLQVAAAAASVARAADVIAAPPASLAVSIYRNPQRDAGSIRLDYLRGFALVSETREVILPAGVSRLRFEGVADGIEAVSAIVSGLPEGVIEKNRDADLLSPAALIAATVGKPVILERTYPKTGATIRVAGSIVSDAAGGVVFQTAEGFEALRCSGLPETFAFEGAASLSARPTLSVRVNATEATTRQVTLTYLTRGFDWAADYTATLSADGTRLDLGAWVTLANSNGESFPYAQTQVIAGKVNRESGSLEPFALQGPIIASCWPRGATSDPVVSGMRQPVALLRFKAMDAVALAASAPMLEEVIVTGAKKVQQEQLGDLKLYRIPELTTVASRQSKQVRLLDRSGIPVTMVYTADLFAFQNVSSLAANHLLRTRNTTANHLGLALPSGSVSVFVEQGGRRLLLHQTEMRDLAVDEEVELELGSSADVQVATTLETAAMIRVDISNARAQAVDFELRVQLPAGARIVQADAPQATKNGRPLFKLRIPANSRRTVHLVTERTR